VARSATQARTWICRIAASGILPNLGIACTRSEAASLAWVDSRRFVVVTHHCSSQAAKVMRPSVGSTQPPRLLACSTSTTKRSASTLRMKVLLCSRPAGSQ
jgi:hypothetical protein